MDEKILLELRRMSKLLALDLVKDMKTNEKYKMLNNAGFQPKEIAEILDTTRNTVSVELSKLKKKLKKDKKWIMKKIFLKLLKKLKI